MTTAIKRTSEITAKIVNPLLSSTKDVFETMLGCTPVRSGLSLKTRNNPEHELSAVIGITGNAVGTIVLSVKKQTALNIYETMLGTKAEEIDQDVMDAVGEITNMIAGVAKAKLQSLSLSISIPNLISGKGHEVHYPTEVTPICLSFESDMGSFCIEAGFSPKE
ncbi:chemotaxis protein CheX [Rubinisphaera sp.]|uniref:chemotaxis protein CheX n=1 Tax=Rubinisphaera sp. TaxID=2024857 RepID=UPI000C103064|nr:chemotaxis protein CheX [Rubinisphaera sp.]MBV09855.1 chemotaxis protein CheX [Rubinisphaera sp.]HCS50917.1 chemotaxis protein CheX [Planctomycetaceae bacterium]